MSIMTRLGRAALAAGVALLAGAMAAPAARADNDINAWGKPDFEKGDKHSAAIWRDDDGWHIRWTTAGRPHDFSGWITTPGGEFGKIVMIGKERGDWARVSPSDKKLVFDTHTEGGIDGFDFRSEGKELTFQLLMDGKELLEQIFIGANGRNPPRLPFTLDKWESHPRGEKMGRGEGRGPRGGGERGDVDINAWGKPDFEKGDRHSAAIWRDDDGWHVRWTTAGRPHDFAGWISTPGGEFTKIVMVGKERGDWARVNAADKKLVFDTHTEGGVDGFDFRSDSKELTFQILMDGKELPEQIFIGKNERNPPRLPFTLDKWESHPRGK